MSVHSIKKQQQIYKNKIEIFLHHPTFEFQMQIQYYYFLNMREYTYLIQKKLHEWKEKSSKNIKKIRSLLAIIIFLQGNDEPNSFNVRTRDKMKQKCFLL